MQRSLRTPALAIVVLLVLAAVSATGEAERDAAGAASPGPQMGLRVQTREMAARDESTRRHTRLPASRHALHDTSGNYQPRMNDSNVVPDLRHQQQHRTPSQHTSAAFDPLRHTRRSRFPTPSNNFHSRLDPARRWDFSAISHSNSSHLPHSDGHAVVPSSSHSFRSEESHDSRNQFSYDRRRSLSSSNEPYSRIRTRQNYSPYASPYGNSRTAPSGANGSELRRQYGSPIFPNSKEMPGNNISPRQTESEGRNLSNLHRRTHSSSDLDRTSSDVDISGGRSKGGEPSALNDTLSRSIDEIVYSRRNALRGGPSEEASVQPTLNSDRAAESASPRESRSQVQEIEGSPSARLQEEPEEDQNNGTSTRRKKSQKKQKKNKKRRNRNRRNRSNKGKKKRRRLQNLIAEQNLLVHDVEGESYLDCCPSKLVVIEKQVGKARDNHAVELHPDSQYFYERVCLDQFEGEECVFPSRALKPWVKTRCAPMYSFSQALVRRYASEDDWSLDYVEVSSGCSCQVSLDSVPSRSRNDRNSNSTSRH